MISAINPATGESIGQFEEINHDQALQYLQKAHRAHRDWKRTGFAARSARLMEAARILNENRDEYARQMAREMGKPVAAGRAEIEKCAWVCEHYAGRGASILQPEMVDTDARKSYVTFKPLGVVLCIMPWNYPFWQVFRQAAPGLMAGNAIVLKHASNVPGCAQAISGIFRRAGFPEGLFQNLTISAKNAQRLIEHPLVAAVSLTGSEAAGSAVAATAGKMLKKSVLELGGSDPYVVLEDADLEQTAETCVAARLLNSGQSCIAAKRIVVVKEVYEAFQAMIVEQMRSRTMGDPLDEKTQVGPQAREDLRETLHRQVVDSIARGARCLTGGHIPDGKGFFYPPTVLADVTKGMPVYDEETFGPVAAIIPVENERHAIRVANDSEFGLGAAVFTRDADRGERIAAEDLEAGNCFVNAFVKSDPRLPFGGIKKSGFGRELSHYGIKEFVNIKTVCIQ